MPSAFLRGRRRLVASLGTSLAVIGGLVVAVAAQPAGAASTAAYTSINTHVDTSATCGNGPGGGQVVNCNLFNDRHEVWLNAGPSGAGLADGQYFFAVTDPGGQSSPTDDNDKRLSTDPFTNRRFTVVGGVVHYTPNGVDPDTHTVDGNQLRLWEFGTSPHGVYQMAICELPDWDHQPSRPSCKTDAFKVKGDAPSGEVLPLTAEKTGTLAYTTTYPWTVHKVADQTRFTTSGDTAATSWAITATKGAGVAGGITVTGTISVLNPNGFVVHGVDVTDSLPAPYGDCTVLGGAGADLEPVHATAFEYSCDLSSVPATPLTNTATVHWDQQDADGLTLAGGTLNPSVQVSVKETKLGDTVKLVDQLDGTGIAVTPDVLSESTTTPIPVTGTVDAPLAGTCKDVTNTITLDGAPTPTSAKAGTQVCRGADLQVSKTVSAQTVQEWTWSIGKKAPATVRSTASTATLPYTVSAQQTGHTATSKASGTITVKNPNDWQDIAITALVDTPGTGGTCTPAQPLPATVKASSTVDVGYTCTWASDPTSLSGTNTATVSWDKATAATPDGTASGTAPFTFQSTVKNQTVTVQDTFNGGAATTLGTLTGTVPPDAAASGSWSYGRTVPVLPNACTDYPNTATILETGASAKRTVTVCGPVLGGHTIGFWQNKNGQDLIKGAGPSSGACSVTSGLRALAPFQDLASTASCAQVASYAANVVKAASAAGASMNAMLKAQMLATALSVQLFSPGLGGVKVDLSSWPGGFGGAAALTVNQMLAYAASQSNAGGTTWYGNVKATQGQAKDAFDAINNGTATTAP